MASSAYLKMYNVSRGGTVGKMFEKRSSSWNLRACWAFAAALICLLTPCLADAQGLPQPVPPESSTLDPRGVDMVTGRFMYSTVEVSISDANHGGLSYGRAFVYDSSGSRWRDTLVSGISAVSPTEYAVSAGMESEIFTKSGSIFTPKTNRGATLTQTGSTYAFTSSSGVKALFASVATGTYNTYGNIANISSVTAPDGTVATYTYATANVCISGVGPSSCNSWRDGIRVQSVVNNRGFQIHYDYTSDSPNTSSWASIDSVIGINNAVDFCAPDANSCTTTQTWPEINYGATASEHTATDQLGRVTYYTLTSQGLTSIRLPGSTSPDSVITYDSTDNVSGVTDASGVWTYAYVESPPNRTTTATGPLGQKIYVSSNQLVGRAYLVRNTLNNPWTYQYDSQNRLTRSTEPEGNYTQLSYDAFGNVTSTRYVDKTGPDPATDIVYLATYPTTCSNAVLCHRPVSTTDARGNVTSYTWNATHGGLETLTAPVPSSGEPQPEMRISYSTRYAWYKDNTGAIVQAASPIRLPTVISECLAGSSCINLASEARTGITYGSTGVANNLLPTVLTVKAGDNSISSIVTTAYDHNGDLLTSDGPISGSGDLTRYRYNADREVVGIVGPDPDGSGPLLNRAQRFTRNARGLSTRIESGTTPGFSDADWANFVSLQRFAIAYDGYGRSITGAYQSAGGTNMSVGQASYDAAGRISCVAQRMNPAFTSLPSSACVAAPAGSLGPDRITVTTYDTVGRPIITTTASGTTAEATEAVTYSANGRPQTLTDSLSNVTTLEYDAFDRLAKVRFPRPDTGVSSTTDYEEYGYDTGFNLTSKRARSGQVTSMTYDALNRVRTINRPSGTPDSEYAYDNLGNLTTAEDPASPSSLVTSSWDALGRQVSEDARLGLTEFEYDSSDRLTRMTWPDATWVSYEYDLTDAMTFVRWQGATSGSGVLAQYGYDNLGRLATVTRGNGATTSYGYDAISRLTSLSHALPGATWDQAYAFGFNPAGQVVSQTATNDAYAFTGNANGVQTYTNNRLNEVTAVNGVAVSYNTNQSITNDSTKAFAYDAANRLTSSGGATFNYDPLGRLSQTVGTGAGIYGYAGDSVVATAASGTTIANRFIRGAGVDEIIANYAGTTTLTPTWWLQDQLGSTIALTNASGAVTNVNSYDEAGRPAASNAALFQYAGQMWMPGPQTYYYRTREYHPGLGRFLQPDTAGYADGPNLYSYVSGDPINLTDPSGQGPTIGPMTCVWFDGAPCQPYSGGMTGSQLNSIWQQFINMDRDRPSIYSNLPGYGQRFGPPVESDPEYQRLQAAIAQANYDNRWMLIPVVAPVAAVVAVEAGAVAAAEWGISRAGSTGLVRAVCNCFVAGTEIQTATGIKAIEQVVVGDLVLSRDEFTGETSYQPVTGLINGSERTIWEVTVEQVGSEGSARRETIGTTDEHPWRLAGGDWALTAELEPGSELVSADGHRIVVVSALETDRVEQTYNFEVREFHTYFVGETGAWVHNACGPSGKFLRHFLNFASRSRARDAALGRTARGQRPMEHSNPSTGDPHFHAVNSAGEKVLGVHYTYPR